MPITPFHFGPGALGVAIMHVDVRPFWPLIAGNSLQGLISIDLLQWVCVGAGVLGIGILLGLSANRQVR